MKNEARNEWFKLLEEKLFAIILTNHFSTKFKQLNKRDILKWKINLQTSIQVNNNLDFDR